MSPAETRSTPTRVRAPRLRALSILLATSGLAALSGALDACSLYANGETVQCNEDSDCQSRGPDFAGTGCAKAGPKAGFCIDARERVTTGECVENADCVDIKGPGSVCAIGSDEVPRCVQVITDECPVVVGNPFIEGTQLFGVVGDILPSDPGYVRDYAHLAGATVALNELQAGRGIELPGKKRIALVGCTQSRPRSSGAHLTELGAKAVVGPTDEASLLRVAEQTVGAKIPLITASFGNDSASAVPSGSSYVFLAGPAREAVVALLNAYLSEIAADVKSSRGSVRVAVVLGKGRSLLGQQLSERLTFNGKTAIVNQNDPSCGNCYRAIEASKLTPAQVADELATFGATVIVPLTDTTWGAQTLPALESRISTAAQKPVYVHPVMAEEDPGYRVLAASDPAFRKRFVGLWPSRDDGAFASFRERYRAATASRAGVLGPEPTLAAARAYDATTALFYAAYSAGRRAPDGKLTGAGVAAAMANVTSKGARRIGPGPLEALDAIGELNKADADAAKVDFDGLLSTFELGTERAIPTRWQIVCLDTFGKYSGTARSIRDGGAFEGGTPGLCR